MKRFNFLSMVITVLLMVTAVSCTTMRGAEDDYYYDRTPVTSNRIYVDDPYRGTVVLERDPYSGRYYEVGSYGGYSSAYGSVYRNNRYSSAYDRNYNRNRNYNNNYNRNNTTVNQGQVQQQRQEQQAKREEARRKVLGGN